MAKVASNSRFENEEMNEEVKVMKEVTIPIDALNKKDSFVPVSINGYIWKIKRGVEVKVPAEVARILKEAGYIA